MGCKRRSDQQDREGRVLISDVPLLSFLEHESVFCKGEIGGKKATLNATPAAICRSLSVVLRANTLEFSVSGLSGLTRLSKC